MLKNINALKNILIRRITKNIGNSHIDRNIDLHSKAQIKRVLICRPNHRLGNLLLITPLLYEVIATFPLSKIDLFVKGNLAPTLFRNYENINHIIQLPRRPFKHLIKYIQGWVSIKKQHYDIVINVDKDSSSGRLSAQFANSKFKLVDDVEVDSKLKYDDHVHAAKHPIYNLRNYLTQLGAVQIDKPIASLDIKLSPLEIAEGRRILKKLVNNEKKTICLFTYATGKKCYSASWWEKFYERLKTEYKHFNIIEVLPIQNVSNISFQAPTFYSKDIRQIGSLIANTEVFIGADSGIMHLASAVQTATIGLFSVTDQNRYEPYNNNSVSINTNDGNTDTCISELNRILSNSISKKLITAYAQPVII